ncbi:hypothetical protein WG922_21200 [Ramlibacter sp. AN1015]|uniref:hypothetical protein n=1 Tax=Ramlibacter sp. AN1015 TaxID=3133428 RepID=UPI0030BD39AB
MKCPRCGSTHISNREVGKRTGATVGSLVGAAVGTASALRTVQVGASIGALAGPVGAVAGGLSGAVVSGLLAGSAGCALGSVAGNLADANFLDNRACLDCGHSFREDVAPTSVNMEFTAAAPGGEARAARSQPPRGQPGTSTFDMHFHEE